uniref:protein-tyrosine-phosphatase n=1 Tax=Strongyloides stercoralis TaxID=6248 RepID=A0A0K0EME1_STRER
MNNYFFFEKKRKMILNPLRLKLGRKYGKYEISQDIFVVTIFISDRSLCQCTLNSESTPFTIIEFLQQKVNLIQSEFYGFKYQLKCNDPDKRIFRWLEFDKPVKKQLDKYACKPRHIQLAILYWTVNPSILCDQMSRSIYFYLIKNDVINGKFIIDVEKYLTLAAYSLQVEYGDYDPHFHTLEFLKTIQLLPFHFIKNGQVGDEYLLQILTLYERLTSMNSSQAAILYLVDVSSSPGYGEEYFYCKDDDSTETSIGYSFKGIIVKKYHTDNIFIPWFDIKSITSSKRHLIIKIKQGKTYQYLFEDSISAKYSSIIFNWQYKYSTTIGIIQKNLPIEIRNMEDKMIVFIDNSKITIQTSSFNNNNLNNKISNTGEIIENVSPQQLSMAFRNDHISLKSSSYSHSSTSISKNTNNGMKGIIGNDIILQQLPPIQFNEFENNKLKIMGSSPEIDLITRNHNNQSNDSEGSHLKFIKRSSDRGRRANLMAAGAAKAKRNGSVNFYSHSSDSFDDTNNIHVHFEKQFNNKFRSTPNLTTTKHPRMGISSLKVSTNNNNNNNFISSSPPYIKSPITISKKYSVPVGGQKMNQPPLLPSRSIILPQSNNFENFSSYYTFYNNDKQQFNQGDNNIDSGRDSLSTDQYNHNEKIMTSSLEDECNDKKDINDEYGENDNEKEIGHGVRYHQFDTVNENRNLLISNTRDEILIKRKRSQLQRQDSCDLKSTHGDEDQFSIDTSTPDNFITYTNTTSSPAHEYLLDTMEGIKCQNNLCFGLEDTLRLLLKKLGNSSILSSEFNEIPKKRHTAGTSTSLNTHNLNKNRSNYILPYEDTRVTLLTTKDNVDGYINASNVRIPLGYQFLHYIVTQNPLPNTINDFWQLIWEKGVYVIVMIQKIFSSPTVPVYWPSKVGEKLKLSMFSVKLKSTNKYNNILILKCLKTGKKKTIYHLQYTELDDYNIPMSSESFLAFLDTVNSVQRHVYNTLKDNERIIEHTNRLSTVTKSKPSRSRSVGRVNLLDVTNKLRSLSTDTRKPSTISIKSSNIINLNNLSLINDQKSDNSYGTMTDSINSSQRSSKNSYTDSGKGSHIGDDDKNKQLRKNMYPPMLVHCIDGTNESGVFLLTDVILKCLENNIPFEINQILRIMRQQRMSLMQSVGQYRFVHSTISHYLQRSRLI